MATTWLLSAPAGFVLTASYYLTRLPGISSFLNAPEIAHRGIYAAHRATLADDKSLKGISKQLGTDAMSLGAGFAFQAGAAQMGITGVAAPLAKGVRCLAAGVRWLDQWTRVQTAAQKVLCILKNVPTTDEVRQAALQKSAIIVCQQNPLNDLLPASSKLLAEIAGSLYYADRASRALTDTEDSTPFLALDVIDTARIFQQNQVLAEKAESIWARAQGWAGLGSFESIKESLGRSGAVIKAFTQSANERPTYAAWN